MNKNRNHALESYECDLLDPKKCLPSKPDEPLASDCCGSGCDPCVFDIYEKELTNWEAECEAILDGKSTATQSSVVEIGISLSQLVFTPFQILSIVEVSGNAFLYRFKLPDNHILGLHVGQHIIARSNIEGETVTRPYTPISSLSCKGYFDVIIKVYPHGNMSKCVSSWQVGDFVEWRGPLGKFRYKPNQFEQISMLAAGTGIAPMFQVIQAILDNEDDYTKIKLLYSCPKVEDILLKDKLNEFKQFWNFDVLYCLTKEDKSFKYKMAYGDDALSSRINLELLQKELPLPSPTVKVLICGTKSFDKDMINFVRKLGYSDDFYFKF